MLVGPLGRAAAELLPGVDAVETWEVPWISADPAPVDRADVERLCAHLAERQIARFKLPERLEDPAARAEIELVIDAVSEGRSVRAELNVPPAARPPPADV